MIPSGLYNYSYALSGGVAQGTVVPIAKFPGMSCDDAACTCKTGGTCAFGTARNAAAFTGLVDRMREIYGGIDEDNVEVHYDWSGLGYSGDPTGPDVDPLVSVRVTGLEFRPTFLLGLMDIGLPPLRYTLTMEDGAGAHSN
jgi:hypothetical protein